MAQAVKLLVVEIDNHSQPFGNTDYVTVFAETADKQRLPVAISHNSLSKKGITDALFNDMIGSHIIVKDDTNIQTGEFTEASFRIQQVLDGVKGRSILLCNGANSTFAASDFMIAEAKEISTTVQAKVKVENDKARRQENARRKAERISMLIEDAGPTKDTPVLKTETPILETNDESAPF